MWHIALRMTRHRLGALVAVFCAVLGGAAFVTATGVLADTALRGHAPAGRLAAADVVIAAPQSVPVPDDLPVALPERARLPATLVEQFRRLPGVTLAVGDVGFPAAVEGRAPVTAHGWSSLALSEERVTGTAPSGPTDIAAPAPIGTRITVTAAGRSGTYTVTARTAAGVYFTDDTARSLATPGKVDLIGVKGGAAAARAKATELGLIAATGEARGDAETAADRGTLLALAASLAGVVLMVIGFTLVGALTVAAAGQQHELALLRLAGAVPRQLRSLAAAQATAAALPALVPGALLGYLLAGGLRDLLVGTGAVSGALPLVRGPLPALAAALLLLAVVQVAGRLAARRPRLAPARPAAWRPRAGLLVIAFASVASAAPLFTRTIAGAAATSMAGMLAAVGLAVAGPAIVSAAGERLPSPSRPAAWLALANCRGYAVRVAGSVSTLAMFVVFTLTYAYAQTTMLAAAERDTEQATIADYAVTAPALGALPEGLAGKVTGLPGVRAQAPIGTTSVLWPDAQPALILTPQSTAVLDLDVRAGTLADLTGDTIAVSTDTALVQRVGVGDHPQLRLGDGTLIHPRVVAVYTRGLAFGGVALSRDLATGHTTGPVDQQLLVRAERPLTTLPPGVTVTPAHLPHPVPATVWINVAVLAVLLGYVLLGVANKLVAATAQRRDEFAALRLIGATPRQIRSMVRREAALIAAIAIVAGLVVSAVPLALLGLGFTARPWPTGPWWLPPAALATVALLSWLCMSIPARRAMRAG
ncbi:ABC transporter permease [Dactylosporangium salmoneum]|uniref:FtsX-like permease family protein n=1 Tax=Dactylosporangium salmoneum TaxID=53361 RepID=A0ABN3HMA3_9ACTN